jgi:serine/threonine protein kinase
MPDWDPEANDLFLRAIEIPAPEDRRQFLDEACAVNPALRARVDGLLRAGEQAGSFLEHPAVGPEATAAHISSATDPPGARVGPGTVVGPYKLMEQLGEGGMGLVFVAEQQQPVRRKVALKVIKPGMDTRQVVARFEAERQALALMDHPNIAKVLDGGTTGGEPGGVSPGRPYFVMELVKGVPITAYCDQNQVPIRERLELFGHVCQAVQHAHQKGIIHRDIKPSNVLVMSQDGTPLVKVIDFGVAKAIGQQLTDKTIYTQFAQLVGTPLYMSPEQAGQSGVDVDTRSDIYSLGVLLYELLTGTTPFDKERLKGAGYDELRRVICEEEPPRPSTRISTLGQAANTVSANRRSDPGRLKRLCQGELDWVVMKALEKDRNRRYETASAFAADVQRYLSDEPVLACPPSAWYRFRKYAWRNKAALGVTGLVLFFVALIGSGVGWTVRDRAAREADLAREQAARQAKLNLGIELALDEATKARDRALTLTDNRYQWEVSLAEASSALGRAEAFVRQDETALDPAVRDRMQSLRTTLDADERDRRFIAQFDELLLGVVVWDARRGPSKSAGMFYRIRDALWTTYGISWGQTPPAVVAGFIQQRPTPLQENLLAVFDVCLTRELNEDRPAQRWLAAVLATADGDPWRMQARQALAVQDWRTLARLVKQRAAGRQRPAFLYLLLSQIPHTYPATRADLRQQIQQAQLGEFWVHNRFAVALVFDDLARVLANSPDPGSRDVLRALRLSEEAVRLAPNDGDFRNTLGVAHYRAGNWKEAIVALQQAVELNKGLPASEPHPSVGNAGDWCFLAMAHWQLGNKAEARRCYDEAEWRYRRAGTEEMQRFRVEASKLLGIDK